MPLCGSQVQNDIDLDPLIYLAVGIICILNQCTKFEVYRLLVQQIDNCENKVSLIYKGHPKINESY